MRGRWGLVALVAGAGLLASGCATVERLSVDGEPSAATAVSDTGYIAGTTRRATDGMFVRAPSGEVTYVSQGDAVMPAAVNDAGTVVGARYFTNGFTRVPVAFRWTAAEGLVSLDTNLTGSGVLDVNDAGVMVGWVATLPVFTGLAVRWAPDGTQSTLPNPSGLRFARATGINCTGDTVGIVSADADQYRLVRWDGDDQEYHDVDPGPIWGTPRITARGDIAGTVTDANGAKRAYLWVAPGYQRTALPGGDESRADGVNDHGDIVGAVRTGVLWQAAEWSAGDHRLTVFPSLGDGTDGGAADVDNAGVVVGSSKTADGVDHAVRFKND